MNRENEVSVNLDHLFVGKRIHITGKAINYKREGVEGNDSVNDKEYGYQSLEVLREWSLRKDELYSLTAPIIEIIVNKALEAKENGQYPPYGLLKYESSFRFYPIKPIDSLGEISGSKSSMERVMAASLIVAENAVFDSLENYASEDVPERDPACSVLKRLKSLIEFRRSYVLKDDCENTKEATKKFIKAGIGTATDVMSNFVYMIPRIYKRDGRILDPEDMKKTAENSFGIVSKLASKHLYQLVGILKVVEEIDYDDYSSQDSYVGDSFNIDYFEIVDYGGKKKLRLKESALNYDLRDIVPKLENRFSGPSLIGCPAMVRFDKGFPSPIEKLWNWHVELAGEIYKEQQRQRDTIVS